jgi:hypothetical protein
MNLDAAVRAKASEIVGSLNQLILPGTYLSSTCLSSLSDIADAGSISGPDAVVQCPSEWTAELASVDDKCCSVLAEMIAASLEKRDMVADGEG